MKLNRRRTRSASVLSMLGTMLLLEHKVRHGKWFDRKLLCHGKLGALLLISSITAERYLAKRVRRVS